MIASSLAHWEVQMEDKKLTAEEIGYQMSVAALKKAQFEAEKAGLEVELLKKKLAEKRALSDLIGVYLALIGAGAAAVVAIKSLFK